VLNLRRSLIRFSSFLILDYLLKPEKAKGEETPGAS
jgi:hypothetical protein